MSIYAGPDTVETGLILCVDAADIQSYVPPATGSLSFSSSARVRLPTTSALQFGSGDFTVTFWLNASNTQTTFSTITDASTNNQAICIGVGTNNGGIAGRLSFFVFGATGTLNSTTVVTDNVWRYVACVKSGRFGYLFINGVLEASTSNWGDAANAFLSGGCLGGSAFGAGNANDNFFNGLVANFAIYNTALYTANFVVPTTAPGITTGLQLLYNAVSSATYLVDSSSNNFTSTVGNGTPVWSSNTPVGLATVWTDVSGQNLNGTLVNGPAYDSANSGSLTFNGTNQQVVISTTRTFTTALTVETWFRSVKATRHHLWNFDANTITNLSCDINDTGFTLWMYWNSGGSPFLRFTTPSLSDGVIRQLVFVHDNNVNTVYLNGAVLTGGSTGGAQTFTTVGGTAIYLGSSGGANYLQGNIYNFKVYNTALTAEQVNQNFQALRGRFGI